MLAYVHRGTLFLNLSKTTNNALIFKQENIFVDIIDKTNKL